MVNVLPGLTFVGRRMRVRFFAVFFAQQCQCFGHIYGQIQHQVHERVGGIRRRAQTVHEGQCPIGGG